MAFSDGTVTTGDLDELLKNLYAPWEIVQLVNLRVPVLGMCAAKGSAALGGTGFNFPIRTQTASGMAYITQSQLLPLSGQTRVRQATVDPTIFIGLVEMTGLAKAVAQTDAAAFARSFDEQVQQTVASMASYKEGVLFRDGSGVIGTVDAAVSGHSAVGGIIGFDDVGFFRIGMKVNFYDDDGVLWGYDDCYVADVDWIGKLVTFQESDGATPVDLTAEFTVTTADSVALAGSYVANGTTPSGVSTDPTTAANFLEPIGFAGAFATSGTYLGVSRATEPNWKSNVLDASGSPLVEDILLRGRSRVEQESGLTLQEQSSMFSAVTHQTQVDQLFKLAISRIRYSGNDKFDLGNSDTVYFGNMPFRTSHNSPTNKCYVGDWSHFMSLYLPGGELHVDTEYNGAALKWSANQDVGISFLKEYCAFACDQPNAFVLYDDLAETVR